MTRVHSLVLPIVLLVVAAVAVAALALFAITFQGPPPRPAPVPVGRIAEALRTGHAPRGNWRSLDIARLKDLPPTMPRDHGLPARDAAIAALVPVAARDVIGSYQFPGDRDHGIDEHVDDGVRGDFRVAMRSGDGFIVVSSAREPFFTHWHAITLLAILAMLFGLGLAAWLIARGIVRPMEQLARAADEARPGARKPIPLEGPREVRALARALETMRGRILEQAENRTAMLAAIAHDLGTPLSRIAYRIEKLPEGERERAAADIEEVRAMLAEVLRFARDSRAEAPSERIDLGSLIESLAEDLRAGGMDVVAEPGPRVIVTGESRALRRLLANLADNAVRYGKRARLSWSRLPHWAEILVDDEGPGFGADREALFAPFVRGETSRNRATGGTGLGLAIVRGIAEAHGGEVLLENREGGGRVRIRLPAE